MADHQNIDLKTRLQRLGSADSGSWSPNGESSNNESPNHETPQLEKPDAFYDYTVEKKIHEVSTYESTPNLS